MDYYMLGRGSRNIMLQLLLVELMVECYMHALRNPMPDAHTVTFTEEEKLAVTAKSPGSIQRETKARGVFA